MDIQFVEEIARRLRCVVYDRGQESLKNAVIVGPEIVSGANDFIGSICGLKFICCPTMGEYRLAGVDYYTARAFEDA